jgi:hypothetical protein
LGKNVAVTKLAKKPTARAAHSAASLQITVNTINVTKFKIVIGKIIYEVVPAHQISLNYDNRGAFKERKIIFLNFLNKDYT